MFTSSGSATSRPTISVRTVGSAEGSGVGSGVASGVASGVGSAAGAGVGSVAAGAHAASISASASTSARMDKRLRFIVFNPPESAFGAKRKAPFGKEQLQPQGAPEAANRRVPSHRRNPVFSKAGLLARLPLTNAPSHAKHSGMSVCDPPHSSGGCNGFAPFSLFSARLKRATPVSNGI